MIRDYSLQTERTHLLRQVTTAGLAVLLIFFLSVYAPSPRPRLTVLIALVALALNGRRSLTVMVAPFLAIIGYGLIVAHFFPGPRPDLWTVLQRPMFTLACLLLASMCLTGRSLRTQYFVLVGILVFSLVGVVGDLLGHDMTALLPFDMPNEVFFDNITMDSSGAARIRGFFPESGVLGAACMSVATITGLGALLLLFARARIALAFAALTAAVTIGGAILMLTITKSGVFLVAFGIGGFVLRLIFSNYRRISIVTAVGTILAVGSAVLFLWLAPATITGYFKDEILTAVNFRDATSNTVRTHMGLFTRVECWKAAIYSICYYPLGVGPWGLGSVLDHSTSITPTPELRMYFDMDIFGLKSGMANLMAETGVVGLALLGYWLWRNFGLPARRHYRSGTRLGMMIAGLYWASASIAVAFLLTCELYPQFAFFILLKCHADAVANACVEATAPELEAGAEPWDPGEPGPTPLPAWPG